MVRPECKFPFWGVTKFSAGGGFRELKLSLEGPVFRGLQPFGEETQNCRNHPKRRFRLIR
ncbi:protein of unknown function [Pseudomonas inefficax]|uniref:Uncharacterized protein n=1 Tax=Pseudomonas inefficax TaxID=2078786 RepID=A0AAQ1P5Z6_9PSED|nr:protein of unknown function [Pseudomonas inefficax]